MERQPDLIASVHLYPSEKGAEGTYTATHLPLPARIWRWKVRLRIAPGRGWASCSWRDSDGANHAVVPGAG